MGPQDYTLVRILIVTFWKREMSSERLSLGKNIGYGRTLDKRPWSQICKARIIYLLYCV